MKAPLAATLICLSGPALAGAASHVDPAPPAPVRAATAESAPARAARAGQGSAESPTRRAPASQRPSLNEPALVLAGLALMAGIALRRQGDGTP